MVRPSVAICSVLYFQPVFPLWTLVVLNTEFSCQSMKINIALILDHKVVGCCVWHCRRWGFSAPGLPWRVGQSRAAGHPCLEAEHLHGSRPCISSSPWTSSARAVPAAGMPSCPLPAASTLAHPHPVSLLSLVLSALGEGSHPCRAGLPPAPTGLAPHRAR